MNRTVLLLFFAVSAFGAEPSKPTSVDPLQPQARKPEEQVVAGPSVAKLLESRIQKEKEVLFVAWNGEWATRVGHGCYLRFEKEGKVHLETVGIDIDLYYGSYLILNDSLIELNIKTEGSGSSFIAWPRMVLRREGDDLLLYREDGKTSWHIPDWPFIAEDFEGFWPLRASKKKKAE